MSNLSFKTKDSNIPPPSDSVDAMLAEAQKQGWLVGKELKFIPELESMYKGAADYFLNLVNESESDMRETFVFNSSRYLFAKAVEGVILWGMSPDGNISIFFHPRHLVGNFETEVPKHLHKTVSDSMLVGESLFRAHQNWVISVQKSRQNIVLHDEIQKTLRWIPKLGISYGLAKNYQNLR